jgi:hypothetical protein
MATYIAKITDLSQYNVAKATITWKDATPKKWIDIYGKLKNGDNCMILSGSELFVGDYASSISKTSVTFNNIKSVKISTDDLLRIDVLNPESLAWIKRPNGPSLKNTININAVYKAATGQNFISFYIVRQGHESSILPTLKTNDRIIIIDKSDKLTAISIIANGVLQPKSFGSGYFNAQGKTLQEILQITQKAQINKTSNNVKNIQRIISVLGKSNSYQFPSFNDYYNIIHNKRLYSNNLSVGGVGNINSDDDSENDDEADDIEISKNIILYGPPGTGKTFHSISHAVSLIRGVPFKVIEEKTATKEGRKEVKEDFDKLVENGQIVFTTFHQSMCYEDFIEGIKPLPPKKDCSLNYDIVDGIFKELCSVAEDNWLSSKDTTGVLNPFEEVFDLLKDEWEENKVMKFEMITKGKEFTLSGFTNKSIHFKKASGSEAHTLSIKTLKDIYYKKRDAKISGLGTYYPGVVIKLKSYTVPQKEAIIKNKYVIIIDEINRGNVSQIFGELITLIESDKRLGESEALTVTLPYSRDEFGIPPNLYIIGTMNTADRSVEAIDTALRRRFSFIHMEPKEEKLTDDLDGINLRVLLESLNNRLRILKDIDHTIGHAWLMGVTNLEDLKLTFKDKILPLLQEYFYNDYEKLGLVLGDAFFELPYTKVMGNEFAAFGVNSGLSGQYRNKYLYKLKDANELEVKDFKSIISDITENES